jgi:broad specificity phosphatase PhoE
MATIRTSFTVIRHGETEWNLKGLHQGILDSPLTARGIEQAEQVAKLLQKFSFDQLYSSDLGRAVQTTQIISAAIQLDATFDPRLRERNLGQLAGLSLAQFRELNPEACEQYIKRNPEYVVPGGESAAQAYERSIACFEELSRKYPNQNILVVTHGFILEYLLRYSLGIPLGQKIRFSLKNCGVNRFVKIDHEWMLDTWGETGTSGLNNQTVFTVTH